MTSRELLVLGSGTAVPSPTRGPSGYYVTGTDGGFLLDCGPGTLRALARSGFALDTVRRVFLTHFHPDHTLDLMALVFGLTNPRFHGRYDRLEVWGPAGLEDFWSRASALYGRWLQPVTYELVVREVEEEMRFGEVEATTVRVAHTENSIGYRFRFGDGYVFAYSGDTGPCPGAVELGADADLYLLECAFPDGSERDGHLTPTSAGLIAAEAACRRLVLTHFYPECEETDVLGACRRVFDGDVSLAFDGARMALSHAGDAEGRR